jgi:hypothetical protein
MPAAAIQAGIGDRRRPRPAAGVLSVARARLLWPGRTGRPSGCGVRRVRLRNAVPRRWRPRCTWWRNRGRSYRPRESGRPRPGCWLRGSAERALRRHAIPCAAVGRYEVAAVSGSGSMAARPVGRRRASVAVRHRLLQRRRPLGHRWLFGRCVPARPQPAGAAPVARVFLGAGRPGLRRALGVLLGRTRFAEVADPVIVGVTDGVREPGRIPAAT